MRCAVAYNAYCIAVKITRRAHCLKRNFVFIYSSSSKAFVLYFPQSLSGVLVLSSSIFQRITFYCDDKTASSLWYQSLSLCSLLRWPWEFKRPHSPRILSIRCLLLVHYRIVSFASENGFPSSFWNKSFCYWYAFFSSFYRLRNSMDWILTFYLGAKCPELKHGLLRVYSMRFCPYAQRTRLVLAAKQIQ